MQSVLQRLREKYFHTFTSERVPENSGLLSCLKQAGDLLYINSLVSYSS